MLTFFVPEHPVDDELEAQQPPAKKTKLAKGKSKQDQNDWTLPQQTEDDLVEWLAANPYLWLRSTKSYKRKREAWELKAQSLDVTHEHLTKWWKNVKDWYLKLLKKTSGQARKQLTERDTWVLKNLSFYKGKNMSCLFHNFWQC